ncbi:MAG: MopE-related protein [Myxococcota bacterium]
MRLALAALLAACSDQGVTKHDTPPKADILSPIDGYRTRVGAEVQLLGTVYDAQTAPEDMTVLWLSGEDPQPVAAPTGSDGETRATWTPDSPGTVSIVLSADADGEGASSEISIEVIADEAPTVAWTAPDEGATVLVGVTLEATVDDADDGADALTLAWTANGSALADCPTSTTTGDVSCETTLPEGQITLCLAATDPLGATGEACRDVVATACEDIDGDGYTNCDDCDETDVAVNPAAIEVCNDVDDDCDGATDEDDAADASTWYADTDEDGFGDAAAPAVACDAPEGHVADATDCDDADDGEFPGAIEWCDGDDDDCDGTADEPDAADAPAWYADADADGYGDAASWTVACSAPAGHVADDTDCDDAVASTNPGATEVCNEVDDDCDVSVDEGVTTPFYADDDEDGFGDAGDVKDACTAPAGYVADDTDCDDTRAEVNPDGVEVCSGLDEDCDGTVDWDHDVPEDYGTIGSAVSAAAAGDTICVAPGTYSERLQIDSDVIVEGWDGPDTTILDGGAGGITLTLESVSSAMEFRGFTVRNGLASSGAAGIYLESADAWLDDLIVEDNACTTTTGTCLGTAIGTYDSDATITNTVIRGNDTDGYIVYGGALAFSGGSPVLEQVMVVDNTVSATYEMSLVFLNRSAVVSATNLIVAGNDAAAGDASALARGTIALLSGSLTIENATITGNTTTTGTGSYTGTLSSNSSSDLVTLVNVALTDNTFTGTGGSKAGGIYKASSGGTFDISYCDVYGNTTNQYSGMASQTGSNGNISAAPAYADVTAADAETWDLAPSAGSPLIDAGDPAITDVDGTTSDIGALGGPEGSGW